MVDGTTQAYDEPDRLGFEKLLALPLVQANEIVLIGWRHTDQAEVEISLSKFGATETQKHFNHFHLLPASSDIAVQREWAFEFIDSFRRKALEKFPELFLIGEIKDDGIDLEVTFWTTTR